MTTNDPSRALDDDVAGCAAAHQRLLGDLDSVLETADVDPTQASRLPGWTVGHVLTHLARNADALRNMIEGAAVGETRQCRLGLRGILHLAHPATKIAQSAFVIEHGIGDEPGKAYVIAADR